ncbi:hypothetical protein PoB_005279300 [Plakobranchus ocellatus]|uniref:Uncharacterized protein n=1 Tax=Plakobranchus ocellatus TaxID=259542 RepID=A0AAV4C2Z9_9GAST|nr:hypothetical protein PoB_005279300 [Plakobranchus ocellatus]
MANRSSASQRALHHDVSSQADVLPLTSVSDISFGPSLVHALSRSFAVSPKCMTHEITQALQPSPASPQQGDLRLSGPPSGHGASGGAKTRDRRIPADLRADTLATEPLTFPL